MVEFRERRVLSLTASILSVILVLACPAFAGPDDTPTVEAKSWTDTLRIGFMENIDSLNPFLGLNEVSQIFYGLVYDSMQSFNEDLNPVSNLALESRVVDVAGYPYGSIWEYDITPNAVWHDGEPFTAADVEWNINLNCMGPNYTDMWVYQPYAYFAKYAEIVDPDTVRVTYYDRETGSLTPCVFGNQIGIRMVPKHLLDDFGTSFVSFQWSGYFDNTEPKLVGTGPFMVTSSILDEFVAGDQITLVANPDYHGFADSGKQVHFNRLIMLFYDDDTAMKLALERGEIDVAQFPANTFKAIEDEIAAGTLKNVETYSGLKCTQYWTEIGFNMNEAGPNQWRLDPLARQALAQAVNKTYIINNYYKGYGREGTGLISPVTPYWHWEPTADEHWDYDLTAAAAALEAAGYVDTDADGVRECTISSRAVQEGWSLEGAELNLDMIIRMEHPEEKEIAKYLQEQWALIGVDLTYTVMLEDVLAKNVYAYNYDSMIWEWDSAPDPSYMLFSQSRRAIYGWSDNFYRNPAYDENYTNSVGEFSLIKRQEYVQNCQNISYRDAAYIILAYADATYAWRTQNFTGWGNWSENPGRSIDAHWGANPLYFDLTPADYSLVVREHDGDFRIPVPEDWTVEENVTREGEEIDMLVSGPVYNNFMTNVLVTSERERGASESASYLFRQMNSTVEDLSDMGYSVRIAGNATLWQTDNYSAIAFTVIWNDPSITQRIALYSNAGLDRVWVVVCSAASDAYPSLGPCFGEVTSGFEVIREKDGGLDTLTISLVVGAVAIVAVVAVLAIILLKRRTSSVPPMAGTSAAPGAGFCPACGHQQAYDSAVCGKCGKALPSPPFGASAPPPPPT